MSPRWAEQWQLLPELLGYHVLISGLAILAGVSVSLPLGLLVAHMPRVRLLVLTVAGVIQTIPGLALLAAMVTLLGSFGFLPALLALFLYSLLPTLRNTVTGIVQVDASVVEAARAAGMSPRQILMEVQLPLAMPVIVAGVRTAAVWVIGIATLSTPVGQPSLGNFIFSGLQTRNSAAVVVGCLAAALLALVVDQLLALLESGIVTRTKKKGTLAVLGLVGVFSLGGLSVQFGPAPTAIESLPRHEPSGSVAHAAASLPALRIGAKTFTEQYVLAALLEQTLQDAGYRTTKLESLGSSVIFEALAQGHIDLYVDYTGTLWANAMQRKKPASRWRVRTATAQWLAEKHGIRQLGGLGFENAYALAVRAETATRLNIQTVTQLAQFAPALSMGGDYEFFQRPEWQRLQKTYDLHFRQQKSFDSTFLYPAVRDRAVDVITAFSSDGRIEAFNLRLLADPRAAFPPYDAVLLLGPRIAEVEGIVNALLPLVNQIPVALMRQASLTVDSPDNPKSPSQAARWLRQKIIKNGQIATSKRKKSGD